MSLALNTEELKKLLQKARGHTGLSSQWAHHMKICAVKLIRMFNFSLKLILIQQIFNEKLRENIFHAL
jgi:hypothetical protein